MNFLKQQAGSALIMLMIVVCVIALLYFFQSSGQNNRERPAQAIDTYQKASDDLDAIRNNLDEQNIQIRYEISSSSLVQ